MGDDRRPGRTTRRLQAVGPEALGSRVLKDGPARIVVRIQDAADGAVGAVYGLRAALHALDDSLPDRTGLVRTPLGIVCAPDEPRCVALTTRGPRCSNPVFDSPGWSGSVLASLHERADGFPSQLCRVHRRRTPGRALPVEWFIVADASLWGELRFL